MKVKLLQITQNPIDVMWTAARTCYSAKSPIEMWEDSELYHNVIDELSKREDIELITDEREQTEKHWNLVKKVLDSGHQSVAEHVYFTFAIEGISRACSHQLVRHRAGIVFSQQSQRYVEIKEDYEYLSDLNFSLYGPVDEEISDEQLEQEVEEQTKNLIKVLNKYFVGVNEDNCKEYLDTLIKYAYDVHKVYGKKKAEDARMILPNATKTNITMSLNYRELIHICNLRLCTRAQKEIRDLFGLIKKEVQQVDERLASYLVPKCEVYGVCTEHQCCDRKPKLSDVMSVYKGEVK